jgi:hypothetical protein
VNGAPRLFWSWSVVSLPLAQGEEKGRYVPFGAAKCITLPSSLNMFTSSIAWMGCTFIFFSVVCSFLSSVPELLCTFFVLRRGVPLPLWEHVC